MEIKPPPLKRKHKHYPGEDIHPGSLPYGAVVLLASPGSGKTTMIHNIIEKHIKDARKMGFDLKVDIMCPSAYKGGDETYEFIEKMLKKEDIPYRMYLDNFETERTPKGKLVKIPIIPGIIDGLKAEQRAEQDEEEEEEDTIDLNPDPICSFGVFRLRAKGDVASKKGMVPAVKKEPKKEKKKEVFRLFVIDDVPDNMRDSEICDFVKVGRHYKTRVILASQDVKDPSPSLRGLVNQLLIGPQCSRDRVESLYDIMSPQTDFETFLRIYRSVTTDPADPGNKHHFLNYNKNTMKYRHNFDAEGKDFPVVDGY